MYSDNHYDLNTHSSTKNQGTLNLQCINPKDPGYISSNIDHSYDVNYNPIKDVDFNAEFIDVNKNTINDTSPRSMNLFLKYNDWSFTGTQDVISNFDCEYNDYVFIHDNKI